MTVATHPSARVLLISGSGRSGTTIVSVLLSQGAGVLNIGQLRDIWQGWETAAPCTCGRSVRECALWGAVRADLLAALGPEALGAMAGRQGRFIDAAAALGDWNDATRLRALAQDHADYLDGLGRAISALAQQGQARTLIDSSKSPEFALAVHLTGQVDCVVLNMVRDPRAVAVSWARKKAGKIGGKLDAWKARQARLSAWDDAPGLTHRSLSYEGFVADPAPALSRVLACLGETLPETLFHAPQEARVSWARQHLFPPSNERVLAERAETVVIRAPQDWRAPRHWALHLRALMRSFPSGPAYAFGLNKRTRARDI